MQGPVETVKTNPNAVVGGTSGAGGGLLVVWALGQAGVHLTPEEAVPIAGAVTFLALYIGRNGLKGCLNAIWRGTGK